MRLTARHKINQTEITGIVFVAAFFSAITRSVLMFIVIFGILAASGIASGDIRLDQLKRPR